MKKKYTAIFTFLIIVILFFIYNNNYFNIVYGVVNGNYNRTASNPVQISDWNFLDLDFFQRDGANTYDADMNMSNNSINNLTNGTQPGEAVNINGVNSLVALSQGGAVYTNWGNQSCGTDIELYRGYSFGGHNGFSGGPNNNICMKFPFDGSVFFNSTGLKVDSIYPSTTEFGNNVPSIDPSSSIQANSKVACAVCLRGGSACYYNYGSQDCSLGGFTNKIYDGYVMGSNYNLMMGYNSTGERVCVNKNFQFIFSNALGENLVASKITNNFGVASMASQVNKYLECSLCCN